MTSSAFWSNKKVLVTGGAGFLGSHLIDNLVSQRSVQLRQIIVPRSNQFDLRKLEDCEKLIKDVDIVFHLAARVGGIGYNQKFPGNLFYDNAMMGLNMIESARRAKVEKFVQVGTVCAYPKYAAIPFKEDDIWNGYPEETNAPYGIAKKSLLVMAQAYRQQYGMNIIYLLPVNLYGPGDNFDLESSHVIPALIRKFVEAKNNEVTVWGTGKASREFLYVEDAAEGILLAAERYSKPAPVNLGTGREVSIRELVDMIARLSDFNGKIVWDTSRPDGQPRRMLDTARAFEEFGFRATTQLEEGLKQTIDWYRSTKSQSNGSMKNDVRAHYNKISGFYEQKKRETYLRILRNSIADYNPRRAIDLGCGTGMALSWLTGDRVGVDFSQDLLRKAHDGPDYVVADVEATPFRDEIFDLAICLDVAEHLPSLRVVDEAYRILADGATLQLSTADPKYEFLLEILERLRLKLPEGPHKWRNPAEIIEKMEKTGFKCEQWTKPPIRFYKGIKTRSDQPEV